jgi:hypothetical protein
MCPTEYTVLADLLWLRCDRAVSTEANPRGVEDHMPSNFVAKGADGYEAIMLHSSADRKAGEAFEIRLDRHASDRSYVNSKKRETRND